MESSFKGDFILFSIEARLKNAYPFYWIHCLVSI